MEIKGNKNKIIIGVIISLIIVVLIALCIIWMVFFRTRTDSIPAGGTEALYINMNESNIADGTDPADDVIDLEIDTPLTSETDASISKQEEKPAEPDAPYYIKVNNQANVVTIYKKGRDGDYTEPVKTMVCSVGRDTPAGGTYAISDKYTWRLLVGGVYGQYASRITGQILFHSVPYQAQDKGSLEWWEYDKLGESASLGCVRLSVADAKWIYDNCKKGTKVEFYSSSTPRTTWQTNCTEDF